MHELERIKVIEAVCEHRLTMVRAAERLRLCERQISRLARRTPQITPQAACACIAALRSSAAFAAAFVLPARDGGWQMPHTIECDGSCA